MTWEGADQLADRLVAIPDLRPHPRNPRRGNVEVIAASLKRFGQLRPILVQASTNYIVAGNHTYAAAVELGWDQIAAVVTDMDDDRAAAYLLADNRTAEYATYDEEQLADVLRELEAIGGLEGTGWTADDFDDLMSELDRIATTEPVPFEGGYAETPEEQAVREQRLQGEKPMRQVVMLLEPDEFSTFAENVDKLKEKYGVEQATVAIVQAVAEAAA